MLLTNKHFIIALIVAPILAVITYFAVDKAVSEPPQTAVSGEQYPLAANPNCRYESGKCTLRNGDVKVELLSDDSDANKIKFTLSSKLPLQGVKLALAEDLKQATPQSMLASNAQQTEWQLDVANTKTKDSRLLLVVSVNDSLYYAETEATFIHYETSFPRESIR